MSSIAAGVEELRLKHKNGIYRVFYYVKFAEAILIFHAFIKKTEKTPTQEIETAKKRLKEMLNEKN